ncbi:unnamed protein product, partial [Phaeothamnion confervicola]
RELERHANDEDARDLQAFQAALDEEAVEVQREAERVLRSLQEDHETTVAELRTAARRAMEAERTRFEPARHRGREVVSSAVAAAAAAGEERIRAE